MIKCNDFFILANFICVQALVNNSFLKGWIMNDILRNDKICSFSFQISFVDTVFKFISILCPLLVVADFALIEEAPNTTVIGFISVEHVVAVLTESLPSELCRHFITLI